MPSGFLLQGIIFLVVFVKIQRLELGRNSLAGVIFELSALVYDRYHTPLGAKDLVIIDLCSVGAVCA